MQKKSLLVALFCGALCLTGCLKNEESASVAQVRIAKANELNSIADLNKAKAAAEAVYAQAELVVAQAEAKLREAQANLVNAQAETEKVRAELLKVRVALAEVQVDEEKVKLLELEAKLEQTLAEVEAAVAKAESEKQKWVNELEHQIALAEKQAIDDALAILKAEDALQKYLLDQEGVKAENAKAASLKYFAALKEVQNLQRQQIVTKAEKALVEAGAVAIRDAIHFEMEQIDDEIAKKEALVEYLKEHQTMTPEEAEEALIAARTALNEAYNDYKDAQEAESDAQKAYNDVNNQVSAFTYDWDNQFRTFIKNNWSTTVQGYTEYEGYDAVTYRGYFADPTDPTSFIKLWTREAPLTDWDFYPTIEEQSVRNRNSFNTVDKMVIAPAQIFYDNVNVVLDSLVDRKKKAVAAAVEGVKKESEDLVKGWQAAITNNNKKLALHQQYVDARKDTIAKYESDLAKAVEAYNNSQSGKATALQAYLEYMVINYEVPAQFFEAEIIAAKDTVAARSKYTAADDAWKTEKGLLETEYTPNLKNASDADSVARVAYKNAETAANTLWTNDRINAYIYAANQWSPVFEGSYQKVNEQGTAVPYFYKYHKRSEDGGTANQVTLDHLNNHYFDTTGLSQKAWLVAMGNEELKLRELNAAKAAYAANPTPANEQVVVDAQAAYNGTNGAVAAKNSAALTMQEKEGNFNTQKGIYEYVWKTVDDAKKAWNPDFEKLTTEIKRESDSKWYRKDANNKKVYAGTAQADSLKADSLYWKSYLKVYGEKYATDPKLKTTDSTLLDKKNAAQSVYNDKKTTWNSAFETLLTKLNTTKKDYKADSEVARLYEAASKPDADATTYDKLYTQLKIRYGFEPNPETGALLQYLAPVEVVNTVSYPGYQDAGTYNQLVGLGWLNSNYHLNPKFEYIASVGPDETGKIVITKEAVAKILYDGDASKSLSSIVAADTKSIADEPAALKVKIAAEENKQTVKDYYKKIEDIRAALKQYQSYEAAYKTWVSAREEAFKAWNEAKKDTYDAADEKDLAQAIYDGVVTLANGGMWVYDPDWKIFDRLYPRENHQRPDEKHRSDDFTWINVNDEIETLEGDTADLYVITGSLMRLAGDAVDVAADMKVKPAELGKIMKDISKIDFEDLNSIGGLNFAKSLLQEALKVGKVTLQYVLDAFDEEIAVLDEKIDLYTKLAATYKAIMNGWLGIVDEAVVEEPVEEEGEGDDEE